MNTSPSSPVAEHSPARPGLPLAERAQSAAAVASEHAAQVDSNSRFPSEAFDAIRAQQLLGILVPSALGGEQASVSQVADVCYCLAQNCAATGMIYAMHQVKVACLVRHRHESAEIDRVLRRLCADQLLLASSTTEGQAGGNVRSSEAAVAHADGQISLERQATVISYGAHADGIVTTARRSADAAPTDQVLIVFLKSDYTLSPIQGWQTLGMRGTCSEGYVLRAKGTPGQILPEPYASIHAHTMVPFAHLLWGSVWAGIASGAASRAQTFVRTAARKGDGALPPGAPRLAEVFAKLKTLRGMLSDSLRRYEIAMDDPKTLDSMDFQSQITLTKVQASELAVSTVLTAMRVCGLSGYRCDSPYSVERHLRDVLSSPLMINNDRILSNFTATAMMAPISGTLSAEH